MIADDHFLVREGVRQLLELEPDLTVVASVGTAVELLDRLAKEPADLVLTDIRMPPDHDTEGISAAHEIRRRWPGTGVVVLSAFADAEYAVELFREGTERLAYLLKDRVGDRAELIRVIRAVLAGGSVIDPAVVEAMLQRGRRPTRLGVLSERERAVLEQMAGGRSNPAIAAGLHLSVSSVEKHIGAVFDKLDLAPEPAVHRRVAAVLAYLAER
jgi:DNA-binding NarL/FixJ family response regulator